MNVNIVHRFTAQQEFLSLEAAVPHREIYGELWLTDLREAVLTCSICHKEFDFNEKFLHHCLEHYDEKQFPSQLPNIKQDFECEERQLMECRPLSPVLQVEAETITDAEFQATYKCRYCGDEFNTGEECEGHERLHDDLGDMLLGVPTSPEGVREPEVITIQGNTNTVRHQLPDQGEKETAQDPLSVENTNETGNWRYKCRLCFKSFANNAGLCGHGIRKHADDDGRDEEISDEEFLSIKKEESSNEATCKICLKTFKQKNYLTTHERIHTGERPYPCRNCGQRFKSGSNRNRHQQGCKRQNVKTNEVEQREHAEEKAPMEKKTNFPVDRDANDLPQNLETEFSGRHFSTKAILKTHHVLHLKKPGFECEFCGKKFQYKQNLELHQRIHTGERPYPCCYCGQIFKHDSSRNSHQKICKEKSQKEKREEKKEESSDEATCTICLKTFKHKYYLTTHERIHTGVRPYPCRNCGQRFNSGSNRNRHQQGCKPQSVKTKEDEQREHDEEAPMEKETNFPVDRDANDLSQNLRSYPCRHCGQRFKSGSNRNRHQQGCKRQSVKTKEDEQREHDEEKAPMEKETNFPVDRDANDLSQNLRPYPCRHCGQRFKSGSNRKRHQQGCKRQSVKTKEDEQREHDEEKAPMEKETNFPVDRDANESSQNLRPYPCRNCGQRFKSGSNRNRHQQGCKRQCVKTKEDEQREHHEEKAPMEKETNFPVNRDAIDLPQNLETERVKAVAQEQLDKNKTITRISKEAVEQTETTCQICGKIFAFRHFLEAHLLRHSKPLDADDDEKQKETSDKKKPFHCEICGNLFSWKQNLKTHMLIHTSKPAFECKFCSRKFYYKNAKESHERLHTGERPFSCELCSTRYASRPALVAHQKKCSGRNEKRENDSGVGDKAKTVALNAKSPARLRAPRGQRTLKQFICEHCGYVCPSSHRLQSHQVSAHNAKTPYPCSLCGKNFFSKVLLEEHVRRHMGSLDYSCKYCPRKFVTISNRNRHEQRQHEIRNQNIRPHQCDICPKAFYTRDVLNKHKASHRGERRFFCQQCNAGFVRKAALMVHQKIHANAREYKCHVCGMAFNQSATHYQHMKHRHNITLGPNKNIKHNSLARMTAEQQKKKEKRTEGMQQREGE